MADDKKLKAQTEAVKKIQELLAENDLVLVVEHLIKVVPKK